MEQEKRMRREIANSNERRRMESINAGFQTLKTLLPKRDGEKISKASILQQTSEFITQLQKEKSQMTQQLNHYKIVMEAGGLKPLTEFIPTQEIITDLPSLIGDDLPTKKRRKYEAISTDSSDEGLGGMMSDPETQTKRQQQNPRRSVTMSDSWCQTVDDDQQSFAQPTNTTNVVANMNHGKIWESEILKHQLMEIQLALDREQRLRSLLEEQMRNVEINRLQSLSRLSLLEYSPAFQAVIHSPLLSAAVGAAASGYGNMLIGNNNNSNVNPTPSPQCMTTTMQTVGACSPSVIPKVLSPLTNSYSSTVVVPSYSNHQMTSSTNVLSTSAPANFSSSATAAAAASLPPSTVRSSSPIMFHPPVVVPPSNHHGSLLSTINVPGNQNQHGQTVYTSSSQLGAGASALMPVNHNNINNPSAYANSTQSKQSLEAIVEAIRHLEGDQLFVDDSSKWQTMMLHQPADLCYTTTEHCVPASYSLFRQEKC